MNHVVIAGAGPNGLMLAGELGLAGIRPVVLEPLSGPNPQRRANGITGQAVRLLDHRGLYTVLAGTPDPPQPSPWAMFAAMALDLTKVPDAQQFMFPVQQPRLVQMPAERVRDQGADLRWGHRLAGFEQHADGVVVHVDGPDGSYDVPAKYLVGADGGTSQTRKLAGIDFPGMTSHDAIARMAFGVVPPDDWVDPVTGPNGADPALLDTYATERRPAAERVVMHSRSQLALVRPGTEATALRELFAELLEDPGTVRRISDLLSGNDNRYDVGVDAHPLAGRWVPDFAVAGNCVTRRVAELARAGRPLLIDFTENECVAAATADVAEQITVAVGRPIGDVPATALLVRPDGYVAWASSATDPELDGLRGVLQKWFGVAST